MPAPGEYLTKEDQVEGVIWQPETWSDRWIPSRTGRGGRHTWDWVAQCQKCVAKWALRPKKYSSRYKMPVRCPGCMTRRWYEAPGGNSAGSPSIATEPPKVQLVLGEKGSGMTATAYEPVKGPLSEESIMASHKKFQERDRVKEFMARPGVSSQAKVVYHTPETLPSCCHPGCEKTLADEIMVRALDGSFYCLDHAPQLPGHQEDERQ